jgi:hypothetical protein
MKRRTAAVILIPVATALATVATITEMGPSHFDERSAAGRPTAMQTVPIRDSYALDVTDLGVVMAKTDKVFVADVVEVSSTNLQQRTTTYTVEIVSAIRGFNDTEQTEVTQLGYVDEEGVAHVPEGQLLLEEGKTYVLAGNDDATTGSVVIYAGPHAIRAAAQPSQQEALLAEYAQATQ